LETTAGYDRTRWYHETGNGIDFVHWSRPLPMASTTHLVKSATESEIGSQMLKAEFGGELLSPKRKLRYLRRNHSGCGNTRCRKVKRIVLVVEPTEIYFVRGSGS